MVAALAFPGVVVVRSTHHLPSLKVASQEGAELRSEGNT